MTTFTDNTERFRRQLEQNIATTLEEVGKFIKGKMNQYVAVDTGKLRSLNSYAVQENTLVVWNFCEYAIYQEFGTYKMRAHPFFKKAVYNHFAEIQRIIETGLRRGIS